MRVLLVAVSLLVLVVGCDDAELDAPPPDSGVADAAVPARDAAPRDAGPPPDDLEGFVDWQMRAGGILGLAAAITTPDDVVLTLLRGNATVGTPVDEHTLFVLASMSKPFTGVLVMQLVEEGLLDLDAPVDARLPFSVRHPEHPDVPVTARMLLTHTSGLRDDWIELGRASTGNADPAIGLLEFARDYVADPENWDARPGTAYDYCNAGFGVLGALVEVASGEDFRRRSDERLLAPLDLDGAGWFLADVDRERIATPYTWSERGGFQPLEHGGYAFYPAASLRASITGIARFARAVARGFELDGARVLSDELAAEMRRVPFPAVAPDRAHAWDVETWGGRRFLHHSGATNGGSTQLYVGEDGVGIVVLTNSDAYIRSRFGMPEGADAIREIVRRLDREADALAR